MSSAIQIEFGRIIAIENWLSWCALNRIAFNPNVVGQSAFYQDQIQLILNAEGELPYIDGVPDHSNAKPPSTFTAIDVSSYWMSNLEQIAEVAQLVLAQFGGSYSADPELQSLMQKQGAEK